MQDKQETIAKLYALRGGLSLLSCIHDEGASLVNRIEKNHNNILNCQNDIAHSNNSLQREKEKYSEAILTISSNNRDRKKSIWKMRCELFLAILGFIFLLLIVLIFAMLVYALIDNDFANTIFTEELFVTVFKGSEDAFGITYIVALLVFGFLSITSVPLFIRELFTGGLRELIDLVGSLILDSCNLSKNNYEKSALESNKAAHFKSLEQKNSTELANYKATILGYEKQINADNCKLQEVISKFNVAYQAVLEQFSSVLDERDWANVDLIIFNYETGRALDMRDALLQVDNELRNERLIKAVHNASEAISMNIRRGFGELQATVNRQFNALNQRMDKIADQLSNISNDSIQRSKMIESDLERINNKYSAQNAILEKINISSDKLAADIAYMRQLANSKQ